MFLEGWAYWFYEGEEGKWNNGRKVSTNKTSRRESLTALTSMYCNWPCQEVTFVISHSENNHRWLRSHYSQPYLHPSPISDPYQSFIIFSSMCVHAYVGVCIHCTHHLHSRAFLFVVSMGIIQRMYLGCYHQSFFVLTISIEPSEEVMSEEESPFEENRNRNVCKIIVLKDEEEIHARGLSLSSVAECELHYCQRETLD